MCGLSAVAISASVRSARRPGERLALAAMAGVLLAASFPPVGWWFLAPAGVAGLACAAREAATRTGSGLGLVCGLVFFLPLLHWTGAVAGPMAWVALALAQSLFFAALGGALAVVSRSPGWPLWSAALWVAQEALRDRLPFGGFPWGRLAFSQGASR